MSERDNYGRAIKPLPELVALIDKQLTSEDYEVADLLSLLEQTSIYLKYFERKYR